MCTLRLFLILMGMMVGFGAPAQAQMARTYVSTAGFNTAGCGDRMTPCLTLQWAHDRTLSGGEITLLDPGGYGAVIIDKAISINNDGVGETGMLVSGGNTGIVVNAGPTDAVVLRGLTIRGIGSGGGIGIVFNSGRSLSVENCVIRNLTNELGSRGHGILFRPNASSSLAVSNTIIADNSVAGIIVQPTGSGNFGAVLNRVEVYNNGVYGVFVSGQSASGFIKATVEDSVAANNGTAGFVAFTQATPTVVTVVRSVAASNGVGLAASSANAALRFGETVVIGNARSWTATAGGVLLSYRDNNIDGNGDGDPAPPMTPKR